MDDTSNCEQRFKAWGKNLCTRQALYRGLNICDLKFLKCFSIQGRNILGFFSFFQARLQLLNTKVRQEDTGPGVATRPLVMPVRRATARCRPRCTAPKMAANSKVPLAANIPSQGLTPVRQALPLPWPETSYPIFLPTNNTRFTMRPSPLPSQQQLRAYLKCHR